MLSFAALGGTVEGPVEGLGRRIATSTSCSTASGVSRIARDAMKFRCPEAAHCDSLRTNPFLRCQRGVEAATDLVPADDVPEGRDVVGATVLVVEVIGVLPHVEADERHVTVHDRAVLIRRRL